MMYVSYDHYASIWEVIKYANKYEREELLEIVKNKIKSITSFFTKAENPDSEKER